MKILFIINSIPPQYGGGYLRVFKIAARFKKDGWLYKIITFTTQKTFQSTMGIVSKDIIFQTNKLISSFIKIPYYLIRHKKDFDVLYIASSHWYTVMPTIVSNFLKKKIIIGVTLSLVDSPAVCANNILKSLYYIYKNYQFKKANYIFVNSPLLVNECITSGYTDKQVKLINNPVDTQLFHPISEKEKNDFKQELDIKNSDTTILFIGSINKRKGADLLPIIFEQYFKRTNRKINFIICGQSGYKESDSIINQLKSIFQKNQSTFICKNEVTDTYRYYQIADIFLFPTTNEGMPNVILEAMASGCMIICNTLPGITDYALSQEFLVTNNEVEQYIAKIISYEQNKDIYMKTIQNNISRIEKDFSISNVDKTIKELIGS